MSRAAERLRGIGRWAAAHVPELIVVALGLGLRISLTKTFDVTLGYDFPAHLQYVRYIQEHWSLPPYTLNFSTYNPALYYALAAFLLKLGCSLQAVGRISIICACLQLLVMWVGLEIYLRESRLARVLSLLIFATLPGALHIAGFMSNHLIHDLFCTVAIVLLPQVFLRRGRAMVRYAIGAGLCLGLALLTKISASAVVMAFLAAVIIAVLRSRTRQEQARALLPGTALVLGAIAIVAGWHYVRHKVLYGKFVLIAFDQFESIEPAFRIPYFDRRTMGYVVYWDDEIYKAPFYPSALRPYSRFWPSLVVTTFSDYFNFAFVPRPAAGTPTVRINGKPMRTSAILPARASVMGGTVLALLMVVAWLVSVRTLWRREDYGRLMQLLVVMFAVLAQLHFSVRFPFDHHGVTKGTYLQFAGPVFCALTGLAIAALWNRRKLIPRVLAIGGMAAIALAASYSIFAKIIVPLAG